jgi:hypothetical protein
MALQVGIIWSRMRAEQVLHWICFSHGHADHIHINDADPRRLCFLGSA